MSIISPNNSIDKLPIKHEDINYISPNNYVPEDYDITHFQLANSNLHEFQLHLLDDHHNNCLLYTSLLDVMLSKSDDKRDDDSNGEFKNLTGKYVNFVDKIEDIKKYLTD